MADATFPENHTPAARRPVALEDLRLLSVKELTALIGISRSKIYVEMAAGKLKATRLGGSTRFKLSDIVAYIDRASGEKAA